MVDSWAQSHGDAISIENDFKLSTMRDLEIPS